MDLPAEWKVLYYSEVTGGLLKKISEDVYCFAPGNTTLTTNVRSLQRLIDEIQLAVVVRNLNIQPLYNILVTDFAVKAVGIIKKAGLLSPGLLELFGKAQFLGKKHSVLSRIGVTTGRIKS